MFCGVKIDFFVLEFQGPGSLSDCLTAHGHMPLPPYIQRADDVSDQARYQTVYARHAGAVAAPTAGLHFDEKLLLAMQDRGIDTAYITLHVGAGTFQPVQTDDIRTHKMHQEFIEVSESVCEKIKRTRARQGRIVAVGTTVVRALETAAMENSLRPFAGDTDIFILPGFNFQVVDVLLTNFHLPRSTLLMLVCAFGGYERLMQAYRHAVQAEYRFFSYGDAMLIERGVDT